jgi:hypothetical protein
MVVGLVIAALSAFAALGPALGYFAVGIGGSGSGSAITSRFQSVVVVPATVGSPSSTLLPGGDADLVVQVTNPNDYPVTIIGVSQFGGVVVSGRTGCSSDPAWPSTLGNSGVSVNPLTGLTISVAPGSDVVVHIPGGVSMSTASASGCQGATFQIPVTVVVHK